MTTKFQPISHRLRRSIHIKKRLQERLVRDRKRTGWPDEVEEITRCHIGYRKTRNVLFARDACVYCYDNKLRIPRWAEDIIHKGHARSLKVYDPNNSKEDYDRENAIAEGIHISGGKTSQYQHYYAKKEISIYYLMKSLKYNGTKVLKIKYSDLAKLAVEILHPHLSNVEITDVEKSHLIAKFKNILTKYRRY